MMSMYIFSSMKMLKSFGGVNIKNSVAGAYYKVIEKSLAYLGSL